ncbi:MAG: MBL fold metallo-hydrolase [Burkholderiaceae bacterium]|nr:MBL fold metallo-hydrolase [Burkholderiaceae bacterium]
MKLTFYGAAGEVTGSCLLVEAGTLRFLVDCGMFQGPSRGPQNAPARNRAAYTRDLGRLDFVLLTHAHIDHCGLLPRFAPAAPRQPAPLIYCTRPTADLVPVMLKDSAFVQGRDGRRGGAHAPLYDMAAVDRLAPRLIGMPYDVEFRPHPAAIVRFRNAGHIVGAAFVEVRVREDGRERLLVVSGDLGEASPLLVRDRAQAQAADVLVVESTYGDRNHRGLQETEDELVQVVADVLHKRRGNVIVPAFALGRTQEFLLLLYRLAQAGRVQAPLVFVDSPLARQASEVTFAHLEALDELAAEFHAAYTRRPGAPKLPFALRYTERAEDSMFLNSIRNGALIIAASGMCEAGRIRHHLRHNLPRRECAVLFTGFQAAGTLGRQLVDGAKSVRLFGETVPVRASLHTLGGLSAHAGQDSLIDWLRGFARRPKATFIVHGEPTAAHAFSARIARELRWPSTVAEPLQTYAV